MARPVSLQQAKERLRAAAEQMETSPPPGGFSSKSLLAAVGAGVLMAMAASDPSFRRLIAGALRWGLKLAGFHRKRQDEEAPAQAPADDAPAAPQEDSPS